jgi:hypothetical protein
MQREAECERARGTRGADPLRYLLDVLVDLATFRYRLRIDAALNALLGLGQGVKLRACDELTQLVSGVSGPGVRL